MAEEEEKNSTVWPNGAEKVENPATVEFLMCGNKDKPIMKMELDRLNEFVEVNGESMPAIQGGATAATAVALPTLPTGKNRFFDASAGYWKFNNVVLKNPLGSEGILEGNDGVVYWDGTASTWKISKMQELLKTEGTDVLNPSGTDVPKEKAVSNFTNKILFDVVPGGDILPINADTVHLGKGYTSANPPVLIDAPSQDTYIYEIKDIMYIHTVVDNTVSKRQLVFLNATKQPMQDASKSFFFDTGENNKTFKKEDAPFGARYIGFANLKTNSTVTVTYQVSSFSDKLKDPIIPQLTTKKVDRVLSVTNTIPFKAGDFKKLTSEDATGNITDNPNFHWYRVDLNALSELEIEIRLSTAYPFINVRDDAGVLTQSISLGTGTNYIQSSKITGRYIDFSLSIQTGSTSYFKLTYKQPSDKRRAEFDLMDYLTAKELNKSATDSLQILVDEVALTGGTIYVPAGIYPLRNPVTWKSGVNLLGDGANLTFFKPTGALSAFIGTNLSNYTYRDFCIDGELQQLPIAGYNSAIKGIVQTYLIDVTYRDLIIKNTGASGLGTDFFQSGLVHNVRAYNCGRLANLNASAQGASGIGIGTGGFARGNESLTISDCHAIGNMQNGIFVERQGEPFIPTADRPIGTTISNCHTELNRIGVGISGCEALTVVGCSGYENHHANLAYDTGTMHLAGSTGRRVKIIGFVGKRAGRAMPANYPEFDGDKNGYGLYVKGNYNGLELTNCNFTESLRSGIYVKQGITNLYINGGTIAENEEHGIELNGVINDFKLSPSTIENNKGDGLRINGNLRNGRIKDMNVKNNIGYGVNRVSGTSDNAFLESNIVYNNTAGQYNGISPTN